METPLQGATGAHIKNGQISHASSKLSGCDTVSDFLRRVSDVTRTCLNHVSMYQDVQI